MADWMIRRGIPLALVSGYLAAFAISRGNPSGLCSVLLDDLRIAILEWAPFSL